MIELVLAMAVGFLAGVMVGFAIAAIIEAVGFLAGVMVGFAIAAIIEEAIN